VLVRGNRDPNPIAALNIANRNPPLVPFSPVREKAFSPEKRFTTLVIERQTHSAYPEWRLS
jgi:hypothetical protein